VEAVNFHDRNSPWLSHIKINPIRRFTFIEEKRQNNSLNEALKQQNGSNSLDNALTRLKKLEIIA
jgi:hypothetical protein